MKKELARKGFTLIELLIVLAIIGFLAIIVVTAINPAERLAQTKDASRKSTISQLGHAMAAYATTHGAVPLNPTDSQGSTTNWLTRFVASGEYGNTPSISYGTVVNPRCPTQANCPIGSACASQNDFCYNVNNLTGGQATSNSAYVIYTRLESKSSNSYCDPTGSPPTFAYEMWASSSGNGGIVCVGSNGAIDPGSLPTIVGQ